MACDHRLSFFLTFVALFHFSQVLSLAIPFSTTSSSFSAALVTLQKQIGYEFQSIDLLRRAMTHPSYSLENCRTLSILGLSAVEAAVSLDLLKMDLDAPAKAVNDRIEAFAGVSACAAAGSRLGLENVVRVSAKTDASSPAVVCGAFRAIFGAVALDSGELGIAGQVFWRVHSGGASRVSAL